MGRVGFQLAPKAIDIDLEHMAFSDVIRAPDMFEQEILRGLVFFD